MKELHSVMQLTAAAAAAFLNSFLDIRAPRVIPLENTSQKAYPTILYQHRLLDTKTARFTLLLHLDTIHTHCVFQENLFFF